MASAHCRLADSRSAASAAWGLACAWELFREAWERNRAADDGGHGHGRNTEHDQGDAEQPKGYGGPSIRDVVARRVHRRDRLTLPAKLKNSLRKSLKPDKTVAATGPAPGPGDAMEFKPERRS